MRSMLSFDRGQPIAHVLDKSGKKISKIFITPEKDKPDIEVDNIEEIIDDDDLERLTKNIKLSKFEIKLIKKSLKTGKFEGLNDRLKFALITLKEEATNKLKKKLLLTNIDDMEKIVPLIGGAVEAFDRSIFLTGPSGSGKTYLSKLIMKLDEKNRPIIVFSKIDDDESLRDLKKLKVNKSSFPDQRDGGTRMIKISINTEDDLMNLPSNEDLKNCICFFDDIDSFPREIANILNEYRDSILESGRHHNITVLSTSHQLYNWAKTRVILNESEYVCLFPHANKRSTMMFLKDRMGLINKEISSILNECMDCGRYIICKMSAPNLIMHEKGIILL